MILNIDSDYKTDCVSLSVKTGDDLCLLLVFHDWQGNVVTPSLKGIVFGAKRYGDYDGDFLLYRDMWEESTTPAGDTCLTGALGLNAEIIRDLIGDGDSVDLSAEMTFLGPELLMSSQTLRITVYNDIIKGTESLPPATVLPHYVTKQYVDEMIKTITKGDDGLTPYIGLNGNWWTGDTDLNVPARTDISHLATRTEMQTALSTKTETYLLSQAEYNLLDSPPITNIYAITTP